VSARAERAVCLGGGGRQLDAEADMREVMRLDPSFWFPDFLLSHWRALDGRVDEGLELAERGHALAPWFLPLIAVLAVLLERKGLVERSRALVATLELYGGQRDPLGRAMYHLLRDEFDACANWIERAIEERQPAIFFFAHVTAAKLHSTPRWPKILQLMRLQ
jgi:hypothetical protein